MEIQKDNGGHSGFNNLKSIQSSIQHIFMQTHSTKFPWNLRINKMHKNILGTRISGIIESIKGHIKCLPLIHLKFRMKISKKTPHEISSTWKVIRSTSKHAHRPKINESACPNQNAMSHVSVHNNFSSRVRCSYALWAFATKNKMCWLYTVLCLRRGVAQTDVHRKEKTRKSLTTIKVTHITVQKYQ